MRPAALVAALIWTASAVEAEDRRTAPGRDVVVCIEHMSDFRLRESAQIATRIFADIGVRLEWRFSTDCSAVANAIQVSFSREASKPGHRDVLAYALPFEGRQIVIFKERISAIRSQNRFHLTLAYVLVHEITHILQGICRHSPQGIMKAQWAGDDYFDMMHLRLAFTSDDIERIYDGLDNRFARAQKMASAGMD